jgi:hypothetical protein
MRTIRQATALVACGVLQCIGVAGAAYGHGGGHGTASPEVVIEWNQLLQSTIPATATVLGPRYYAMLHIAQFDAVNSIERRYTPYHTAVWASRGASTEAAAAQAARDVLVGLLPAQQAVYDAALAADLDGIPPGRAAQGVAVGKAVASRILAWRADDGAADPPTPYVLPPLPGLWQGATPGASATFTQVPNVTPFALRSTTQFLPLRHPELWSARYAADFNEVREIGSATSSLRSPEQTTLSRLWAGATTTTTAFAVWNNAARDVARARGLTLVETARVYALLNSAVQDGLLTSMTSKLVYGLWRPQTAIRRAGEDLNADTAADPSWTSLLGNPPYPSYAGNMACIGASSARALELAFGTDAASFTVLWKGNTVNGVANPDVSRSYTSFSQLALQEADSRIWGGIHFRFDNDASLENCPKAVDYAYARKMRTLH